MEEDLHRKFDQIAQNQLDASKNQQRRVGRLRIPAINPPSSKSARIRTRECTTQLPTIEQSVDDWEAGLTDKEMDEMERTANVYTAPDLPTAGCKSVSYFNFGASALKEAKLFGGLTE